MPFLSYYSLPILLTLLVVLVVLLFLLRKRYRSHLLYKSTALDAARKINKIILEEVEFEKVVQKIADYIPNEMKFATGVLAIFDEERGVIRRIAASQTKEAAEAIKNLRVPFNQIEISVNDENNLMARSIRERKPFVSEDIYDVLGPVLTKEECVKIQQIMSTTTTLIYPIFMENKPIGVFIASTKKHKNELSSYEYDIINAFVDGAGIALQHAILYKNLSNTSEQLRSANLRLQELDKMKDEFVSLASHELRTPMTSIKSYLWMTLAGKGGPLTEKQKYYLNRVYNSTDRLIKLVNDMLNVSRIESGRITLELSPVDMRKLTKDILVEISPRSQELGITIITEILEIIPFVIADADKIKEVLINLLGNSLKFTPTGGKITIRISKGNGTLITSVSDTGTGIPPEDISKLFQKFALLEGSYTTNQSVGQGTGLGLYISKSIIELHHGKIWVESFGRGKGSTFSFTLPVATDESIANYVKSPVQEKEKIGLVHTQL